MVTEATNGRQTTASRVLLDDVPPSGRLCAVCAGALSGSAIRIGGEPRLWLCSVPCALGIACDILIDVLELDQLRGLRAKYGKEVNR